jgi:hypothetical protein
MRREDVFAKSPEEIACDNRGMEWIWGRTEQKCEPPIPSVRVPSALQGRPKDP